MNRNKKIIFWISGGMAILLFFLFALWLYGTGLIDTASYERKILADVSRAIKGEMKFEKIDFSFFPWPHVRIYQGSISIPGKASADFEAMSVFPEFFSLVKGDIRISRILINTPDVIIHLPKRGQGESERRHLSDFKAEVKEIISNSTFFSARLPGLILVVKNGRLNLKKGQKPETRIEDIQLQIELLPEEFKIAINCRSDFWKSLSARGALNRDTLNGHGQLKLEHFHSKVLPDYLFPLAARRIRDFRLNLNLNFNTSGTDSLQAEFEGALPYLILQRGKEKFIVKGKHFNGVVHKTEGNVGLLLKELDLDAPQLHLSGNLQMDNSSPRVRLELEGAKVAIDAVRKAVLVAFGDTPDIQKIFDVLKGGRVPNVFVYSQGSSLADLVKLENLTIKGRLLDGSAWVPKADLNLEKITGDVTLTDGVLEGERFTVRLGGSTGRSGILKLGLSGEKAPFYLNIAVDADLAQVPSILKRISKRGPLVQEINLLHELRGNAAGKLVLNGSTESVEVMLDVSEFDLFTRYSKVPYPLKVHGERFFYDKDYIVMENLNGDLGGTSFSDLSVRVDMGRPSHMMIKSGASEIALEEVCPWILSFEKLKDALNSRGTASGIIKLHSLDLKGPLSDPSRWHFQIDGEIHDLAANSSVLKGRVDVIRGEFSARPETLSIKGVRAKVLDASLNGSVVINGYLKDLQKADATLQGTMGPEMVQRISNLVNLPSALSIRAPVSVSKGRLLWERNGKTAFAGSMTVNEGPDISVKMRLDSEELLVEHLLVQDKVSRAVGALAFSDNALGLDFKGNLEKSTLHGLLAEGHFLTGRIEGDFKARILRDQPLYSRIWGNLQGEGINCPWVSKLPIRIESIALDSTENCLEVESALLTWGERRLALSGIINATAEGPRVDLNLWADAIEWDTIEKLFKKKEENARDSQAEQTKWNLPLRGTLKVESDKLKYERFVWSPFIAYVTFDHDGVAVSVAEANLCGISFPGILKFMPPQIQLYFRQIARDQEVSAVIPCLVDRKSILSGRFGFDGRLTAKGDKEYINRILRGNLTFNAYDGRIYRSLVLTKIFSLLNVSKIIRGDFSEFSKEGFAYDSIKAEGEIKNGKLKLQEIVLASPSMNITGEGEIDIIDKKVAIKLSVAPLKTVNFVVGKIPGIRYLTGGNLVSIPMLITGDVADPKVSLFSN